MAGRLAHCPACQSSVDMWNLCLAPEIGLSLKRTILVWLRLLLNAISLNFNFEFAALLNDNLVMKIWILVILKFDRTSIRNFADRHSPVAYFENRFNWTLWPARGWIRFLNSQAQSLGRQLVASRRKSIVSHHKHQQIVWDQKFFDCLEIETLNLKS